MWEAHFFPPDGGPPEHEDFEILPIIRVSRLAENKMLLEKGFLN